MDNDQVNSIKSDILNVLEHPEAEEGLYFRNFRDLHEEDERPAINAAEEVIQVALEELIHEGKITKKALGSEPIFELVI